MQVLGHLFDQNREWARKIKETEPDFFLTLANQQTPEYL
jgi:carbonic anhydrase